MPIHTAIHDSDHIVISLRLRRLNNVAFSLIINSFSYFYYFFMELHKNESSIAIISRLWSRTVAEKVK